VPKEFRKFFFWDFHDAGYRVYSVQFSVLVKGLLEGDWWRRGAYLRSRSRTCLCNLRPCVPSVMVGCIVAAMRQVRMPFRQCSIRRSCWISPRPPANRGLCLLDVCQGFLSRVDRFWIAFANVSLKLHHRLILCLVM